MGVVVVGFVFAAVTAYAAVRAQQSPASTERVPAVNLDLVPSAQTVPATPPPTVVVTTEPPPPTTGAIVVPPPTFDPSSPDGDHTEVDSEIETGDD